MVGAFFCNVERPLAILVWGARYLSERSCVLPKILTKSLKFAPHGGL